MKAHEPLIFDKHDNYADQPPSLRYIVGSAKTASAMEVAARTGL